jgi:hypothetical protein
MKIKIILFGKHTNLLNQRKICIERKTAKQDIFFFVCFTCCVYRNCNKTFTRPGTLTFWRWQKNINNNNNNNKKKNSFVEKNFVFLPNNSMSVCIFTGRHLHDKIWNIGVKKLIQHAKFIFNHTHSCSINMRVVEWK